MYADGTKGRLRILGRCLITGAVFAAATLSTQSALGQALAPDVPGWLIALAVLAIANPLMVLLGRHRSLVCVPAMFIGFSTILAAHIASTAPAQNAGASLAIGTSMNLLGLVFHRAYGLLTKQARA